MLKTIIRKNTYQDSINLMILSTRINELDNILTSQVMMGTDANKVLLENSGLLDDNARAASPNDMIIAYIPEGNISEDEVLKEVDAFLNDLSSKKAQKSEVEVTNLDEALENMPNANVALFSIPGIYGASEMDKALDRGLHVFSFTDNVSIEDEIRLKKKASEKGLLMMGPDCGTGMISNVPFAFTNVTKKGNISIVGASGTGIQEVMCIIDRLGAGVTHAIGTGGRDLKKDVGAITVKQAISALEKHQETEVIVVISKPPEKSVRDEVMAMLQSSKKKVVAIFLGEKPLNHEGKVYLSHTLEEAARYAVDLSNGLEPKSKYAFEPNLKEDLSLKDKKIKALYSGGTLASEAAMLMSETLNLGGLISQEGYILNSQGHEVIDLGDDLYTQGRPHPMIDPSQRIAMMKKMAQDNQTGVFLLDVVLGYGCHEDMGNALSPTILEIKNQRSDIKFVASIVGTNSDPQNYDQIRKNLEDIGVVVCDSNAQAVRVALKLIGKENIENDKEKSEFKLDKVPMQEVPDKIMELLTTKPNVVNIGVESFKNSILDHQAQVIQLNFKPRANGNLRMIKILDALEPYREEIDRENQKVIDKMIKAQPFLVDVKLAKEVVDVFKEDRKLILHAGPPIEYKNMTGPMQGSCVGAVLYEEWASSEKEARDLLESGAIEFMPCHHANAVGPMGGITTRNMPMLVVENKYDGTTAYCIMNEGIGKVLRFGAYDQEVINRLRWMRDVLAPVLSKSLSKIEGGLNLNVIVAKAITMGDEFHQRNIAASLIFLKELASTITTLDHDQKQKEEVMEFLAKTDQFFLNIAMAMGKSMVDSARKDAKGTIVTTMARNGENFGVRIAQCNDEWFTAPVNTPQGLYFTGYSTEDANKDIGDSAITETIGVGGFAMVAAPGVTRFIGAGGFDDALRISNQMQQICVTNNPNFTIATWDYKGTPLGIDIRKVVETSIEPIINTGIAHKEAGRGQVGAGTVRAPLECFEKALEAYAKSLGIEI